MQLWPRLTPVRAEEALEARAGKSFEELALTDWRALEMRTFAPTGGVPISDLELRAFRDRLEDVSRRSGYPKLPTVKDRAAFDREAAVMIAGHAIPVGEGIRPEVWAWIATMLVPHLVVWRWARGASGAKSERFAGPVYRNAIGRLWLAARVLDRGADHGSARWTLLDALGADQVVALIERTTLGGSQVVGRTVGECWVRISPTKRTERLFRESMKALLIHASIRRLEALSEADLSVAVYDQFLHTAARLGMSSLNRE